MGKQCQHPCTGCRYFHGDYFYNRCCNYIFVTGHRRPSPPGAECTAREPVIDGVKPLFGAKRQQIRGEGERYGQ